MDLAAEEGQDAAATKLGFEVSRNPQH